MRISIIGAGNMGGAIACGLASSNKLNAQDITVIDHRGTNVNRLKACNQNMNVVVADYKSLTTADIVIIAVKPWLVESVLIAHREALSNPAQILISVAARISLAELEALSSPSKPIFRVMPNTAIALQESMTFVASLHADDEQNDFIMNIFSELGKAEFIDEKLFSAATSLASCGIAYAFRYVRAAMEGGVEMGFYPHQAKKAIIQTLKGAIELLEANDSHPEAEIDKVTTAGGSTIKGLNEMEHAGFTSAIIRGLKASNV